MSTRHPVRRSPILLATALILAAGWVTRAETPGAADAAKQAKPTKPRLRVTISKETTFITGPLRKDGYVDYVAALNDAARQGVTPENNAAVPFCKAFGPSEISANTRERFFRMLGIDPLPQQGKYIVDFSAYTDRLVKQRAAADQDADQDGYRDKLDKDFDQIMDRPWSKKDFPEMARWLELNEEPLRLIVEGTRRPRYYTPMIASSDDDEPGMVIAVLLPVLQQTREAARLLSARAMCRLGQGKVDAAWQDLLACHRLARLAGQDPTLIGALVGIAIDGIADAGDARLIHHGNLRAEQARKILADLQSLGPLPSMAEKLNTGERYMYLDAVCTLARGRMDLFQLAGDGPSPRLAWALRMASSLLIDWDLILRMGNSWYDRMVAALEKPTHAERAEAMKALDDEIEAITADATDPKGFALSFLRGKTPRQTLSRQMGNVLVALFLPAVMAARTAEDRGVTLARLNQIAFALAGYRAEHGKYPKDLAELAPKYIAKLPVDPFTGKSFRYKPQGEGFLIYSLGPNMEDNGGKVYYLDEKKAAEGEDTSRWDDYRLRIPPESN